jgi:hypothetical protein
MFQTILYFGHHLHVSTYGRSDDSTVVRVQDPNGKMWAHDYGGKGALDRAKRAIRAKINLNH